MDSINAGGNAQFDLSKLKLSLRNSNPAQFEFGQLNLSFAKLNLSLLELNLGLPELKSSLQNSNRV